MSCELDQAMLKAWKKIESKVLGNPVELQRRLDRRAKSFNRVPRALCFAIRAADRRITPSNAWISPRRAIDKGEELEHDVLITSALVKELCCPVRITAPGELMSNVKEYLGSPYATALRLERRHVLRVRRIPGLAGRHGLPVPVAYSSRPLDPCAMHRSAPDEVLSPFWEELTTRLPYGLEQLLRRKPSFRVAGSWKWVDWKWICPGCKRQVRTIYLPMGGPDWAAAHDIKLPESDCYDKPRQPGCFGCSRCHHLFRISRSPKAIKGSWSDLVLHMSGGLLYGREVERPASFSVIAKIKSCPRKRPSPRLDELESYLANTNLPTAEIARRMGYQSRSVGSGLSAICKKRRITTSRKSLKAWWARERAITPPHTIAA